MLPNASSGASLTLWGLLAFGGRESVLRFRLRIAMGVLLYNMNAAPRMLRVLLLDQRVCVRWVPIFLMWRNFIDQSKDRAFE
jgi:hypothetical protein